MVRLLSLRNDGQRRVRPAVLPPDQDRFTATLLSLASFALAFVVRPIGGIIFSHIGDRIGRKKTLVFTLSLMGISTAAMGLLPTAYQVGALAPVLLTLLRLIQGLALGGEWGGGILLAVEYSPPRKQRGFYGAVPQTGALFGLALGNLTLWFIDWLLPEDAFMAWGWRIPFLLSALLVLFGLWIRARIDETPAFRKVKSERKEAKIPIVEIFRTQWPSVLKAIGAKFIETSTFFIFATYSITYAVERGFTRGEALMAVLVAAIVAVPLHAGHRGRGRTGSDARSCIWSASCWR